MPEHLITSDHLFSANETARLRSIAGAMIPASKEFKVPGADDEAIFATVLARSERYAAPIREILVLLDGFENQESAAQLDRLTALLQEAPLALGALVTVVSASYYEDERVLASIGYDARPPFPQGHRVDSGDWSLLDPVRRRQAFYRPA